MAKENILKVRADDKEKDIIEALAKKKGQSVSLYLLEQGLIPSRIVAHSEEVVAHVDESVKTEAEIENERQLKELMDFIGLDNFLDRLSDITRSRSDVKKWGWLLMEKLSGPATAFVGISSEKKVSSDDKWDGWRVVPNQYGEKEPTINEAGDTMLLKVSNGKRDVVLTEGEEGWDYFINQLES